MKINETVIGWGLIIALMIGFVFYQSKKFESDQKLKKEQQKTEQAEKARAAAQPTSIAAKNDSSSILPVADNSTTDTGTLAKQFGPFAAAATGQEQLFVIENDLQKITLTSKGGQIKSIELKKYKTWDKKPLILFSDSTNSLSYQFALDNNDIIDTKQFYFTPVGNGFTVSGNDSNSFALRLEAGPGKYLEERFSLKGNSYMVGYNVKLIGFNTVLPANNTFISVNWENYVKSVERNIQLERRYSALYFKYSKSDVTHLSEDKENDETVFDAPIEWISYKQQFFNTTLFALNSDFQKGKLTTHYVKTNNNFVKQYHSRFTLPYHSSDSVSYAFQFFIGPNDFNILNHADNEVASIIKLSPDFWLFSWIRYITRVIIWIFSWFKSTHLNYGIIILLMTILLKIVLHPLTAKSFESSAKMKILAPELAALKEKYGDDQTKIGQEQMKIYSRAGVSPFGGCLPLLIQMPILMAMYYFFSNAIDLRQQPFLWAPDLSSYDSILTISNTVPLLGGFIDHISLFTILMTITSIGQAVMNNQMNAMGNQQPGMKYMPYIMPLMLMVMFNSFPAALTYYYLLQNLLGIIHQWVIQKFFIDEAKLRKQIEDYKKNPKQVSGWQKKLNDMQKQAEQRAKQRK